MASRGRRSSQEPPPIEIKQFASPAEIDTAIGKLRRRISEVQALDPKQTSHNDQRVYTANDNIHTTILEIFGPNSPEYQRHRFHDIADAPIVAGMSTGALQGYFAQGIPQTVLMLEGIVPPRLVIVDSGLGVPRRRDALITGDDLVARAKCETGQEGERPLDLTAGG